VLFLIEDNGYAISVPVETQTPGGDISRIVSGFPGLQVHRCDGTDYVASYRTLEEAIGHIRAGKGPALVHATVTRPYSHSHSDDERLYKPPAEREAEARRDPLVRLRALLLEQGIATEDELADMLAGIEREVNEAADSALEAPKPDPPPRRGSCTRPTSTRRPRVSRPTRAPTPRRARCSRPSIRRSRTRWGATPASSCSART
jgi:2-oxoisovalerate dehydrogenase E1 component